MESQVQIAESNLARIHIVARTAPAEGRARRCGRIGAARRRGGALLAGFFQGCAAGALRRGIRPAAVRQVRAGLPGGLHRGLQRRGRGTGRVLSRSDGQGTGAPAPGHLPPGSEAQGEVLPEDLPRPGCDSDFRPAAHARKHGPQGHRRAAISAGILRRPPRLDPGSGARHAGRSRDRLRGARPRDQERVHRGVDRPHGQRQLQSADPDGGHSVAHGDGTARLLPLPAANRAALQPGLHRSGAGQQCARFRKLLAELFIARLRSATRRRRLAPAPWRGSDGTSVHALEEVTRSDEDRILRALWNALSATVRTNAYQPYPAAAS